MRIIQASFIISLESPPIENGYLYIEDDGTIIHCTETPPITNQFKVEVLEGIVCPGFINSHCHLELSHMKIPEAVGITKFIDLIPKQRVQKSSKIKEAIKLADEKMQASGIVAVGDICNTDDTIEVKKNSSIKYHSFVELYGLNKTMAESILKNGLNLMSEFDSNSLSCSLVPHAPYSVSPNLLKEIYFHSNGQLLSIHHQESQSENELFLNSSGGFVDLFEKNKLDLTSQLNYRRSSSHYSLIQYLNKNQPILLVHNTFSKESNIDEIEAALNRVYWCTCPKSNWHIERSLPNYNLWLEKKLKITVGTDSLASNSSLSILEEIKFIQKKCPTIPTEELLLWACKNGASYFGYDHLGSFLPGKNPGVLLIENNDGLNLTKNSSVKVIA